MLPTDALRQVLEDKTIAACAAVGVPVRLDPNAPFKQPADGHVWGDFAFTTGRSVAMGAGGGKAGYKKQAGVFQIILYVAEKTGNGSIIKAGDRLAPYFDREQFLIEDGGYVSMDDVSPKVGTGSRNGMYFCIVDGTFDFVYRATD